MLTEGKIFGSIVFAVSNLEAGEDTSDFSVAV